MATNNKMHGLSIDMYPRGRPIKRSIAIRSRSLSFRKPSKTRSSVLKVSSLSASMASVCDRSSRSKDSIHVGRERIKKFVGRKQFITGSQYDGEFDSVDITGRGAYKCFTGTKQNGYFHEGFCNGRGEVTFANGAVLSAYFNRQLYCIEDYVFADGVLYNKDYLSKLDRRFYTELANGLEPAGRSYKTNQQPTRKIPRGCYDVVDGFYNPITKCVYDYDNPEKVLRIPTKSEHEWILKNCRKAFIEVCGYRPDLYENWHGKDSGGTTETSTIQISQQTFQSTPLLYGNYSLDYKLT